MTKEAQFALRRIIEKYTQHTRFCLIANYASKIIPALQSRCMKFRFAPFSSVALRKHVEAVAKAEGLSISDEATSIIVEAACGDVRRGINILQWVAERIPNSLYCMEFVTVHLEADIFLISSSLTKSQIFLRETSHY